MFRTTLPPPYFFAPQKASTDEARPSRPLTMPHALLPMLETLLDSRELNGELLPSLALPLVPLDYEQAIGGRVWTKFLCLSTVQTLHS